MNLRDEILRVHSRAQSLKIADWIGDDQLRFDELVNLFLADEYRVVQRAGWPLSYAALAHPKLITKHFGKLVKNLHKANLHNAIKRNTLRFLAKVAIPKKYQGEMMNLCFNYAASPTEAAAVKAHSLSILEILSTSYPEILPEIKLLIEERWDHETAAFRSRGRKILKIKSTETKKQ